jgi:hypothetical protein
LGTRKGGRTLLDTGRTRLQAADGEWAGKGKWLDGSRSEQGMIDIKASQNSETGTVPKLEAILQAKNEGCGGGGGVLA